MYDCNSYQQPGSKRLQQLCYNFLYGKVDKDLLFKYENILINVFLARSEAPLWICKFVTIICSVNVPTWTVNAIYSKYTILEYIFKLACGHAYANVLSKEILNWKNWPLMPPFPMHKWSHSKKKYLVKFKIEYQR